MSRQSALPRFALILLVLSALFVQCQEAPPDASPLVYVGTENAVARRPSTGCAFRYAIANTYSRLDNNTQREAIRAGLGVWQRLSPNVGFLELVDRPELTVRFADPSVVQAQAVQVPVGLVRGSALTVSALRQESNGSYAILLNSAYDWDPGALTKAVAYQAGVFLGMTSSSETGSLMSPLFVGQAVAPSKTDSLAINKLYTAPCKDLTSVSFLPCSLKVNNLITKTIKLDKQGTIAIKASGFINIGFFVSASGPEGKIDGGLGGGSLAPYNIVPDMFHAALMYKVDNELTWQYWSDKRTFQTNGRQYIDITFEVNDNDKGNNSGAYDVVIDYQ
ncbi:matrixin family metalloprotease [Fibrisoma montanum]|uniref:matrixin family metalloprotease n=1 Tax=Fibrisoma montanum TaxID=2305895 RepID=UPI001E5130D0|nr:matrixin family metalloprotease [Fibrisoma montanum]